MKAKRIFHRGCPATAVANKGECEMRKILIGLVSAIALLGLAACEGGDGSTTQGIDQNPTPPPADGGAGGAGGAGGVQ